jgi:hypothetical protein
MLGEPSNERSANAITTRQRQGDTATYHYIDGLARAIRHAGVIIMDMIPHVYDTKRVLYAIQPDGSTLDLTVDPMAKEHYQENLEAASAVLNPRLGQYEVESDIGPDFGTKREETFNALTTILTQAPQMASMIGDLLMQSADFDLADEAAARLRRAVPKNILGVGPSPEEQALQQQLALLTQKMQGMQELAVRTLEENSKLRVILHGKTEQRDIDLYDSETKRLAAVIKMIPSEQLAPIIAQLGSDTLKTQLSSWINKANEGVGDDQSPTQPDTSGVAAPQPIQNPSVLPQANNGNG